MESETLSILNKVKNGELTPQLAQNQLFVLFGVSVSLPFDEPIFMDWINKYFDHAGNDDLYKDKNSRKIYPQRELYKKYKKAYGIL